LQPVGETVEPVLHQIVELRFAPIAPGVAAVGIGEGVVVGNGDVDACPKERVADADRRWEPGWGRGYVRIDTGRERRALEAVDFEVGDTEELRDLGTAIAVDQRPVVEPAHRGRGRR
jgi:hypothetical protein